MVDHETLKSSYDEIVGTAERFRARLLQEIEELLRQHGVNLAVPIESRVKDFDSVQEKIQRQNLSCQKASELDDLVGIRLILLFKRDVESVCNALALTFEILGTEDTARRLGQTEFGYQSVHVQIKAPAAWLALPSFALFRDLTAEVQVRTISQHAWAAASRVLQYNQEDAIPLPVRRSIYRVSALLETVDLEFERVLDEREGYTQQIQQIDPKESLNVDLLAHLLDENLPSLNRDGSEDYGLILNMLDDGNVNTVESLRELINERQAVVLSYDHKVVESLQDADWSNGNASVELDGRHFTALGKSRIDQGVFWSHRGIIYHMLNSFEEFARIEDR